jgi:hypothetical protein
MSSDDAAIGQQMQTELVRVIFEILINLAYVLFAIGLALGIKEGIVNLERISVYISSPGHEAFLCVLAFIALTIFSISQVFSKSSSLSTRAKRDLDLVVDFLRVAIYIVVAVLMGPFVFSDPQDMVLILSFWSLILAATLFLIRKLLKWYVFLFKEPENLKPWENFKVNSPLMLLQIAQLQLFTQKLQEQQAATAAAAAVAVAAAAEAAKQTPPIKVGSQLPSKLTAFDMDDRLPEMRQRINLDEHDFEHPL